MSDDRPSRRRIAGETGPKAGRPPATGPRVVRKPVRRPGSAPSRTDAPLDDAELREDVEPGGDPTTDEFPGPDTSHAPGAGRTDVEPEVAKDDDAGSPRVVPAGRAPWRRQRSPQAETARAADGDDERGPGSPGRVRRALLVLAAVLAVAFAGAAGYWAYGQVEGSTGIGSAQAEAESAATEAAEQILSYRYDQLDQHLEDSQKLMTPDFGEEFETISPALNDLAPQRQIVVEATAREAAPLPCGDDCETDEAEVLVFVDQARVADAEAQPTVFGNRITLSMVREGGDWLVDDIEAY